MTAPEEELTAILNKLVKEYEHGYAFTLNSRTLLEFLDKHKRQYKILVSEVRGGCIVPWCDRCHVEAVYDKKLWGHICPECGVEGLLTG